MEPVRLHTTHHARTKHVDIKYHFIRKAVERKDVNIVYCPTNTMIADILTKGLAKERFQELRKRMEVETSV